MMILYMRVRKLHKQTWGGWSWESLHEWGQFSKLAIPGLIMICLGWWSAEIAAFVAGALSETELAANAIWFQLVLIIFMVRLHAIACTCCMFGTEISNSLNSSDLASTLQNKRFVLILSPCSYGMILAVAMGNLKVHGG